MECLKYPSSSRKPNIVIMGYKALPNLSPSPILSATSPTTLPGHLVSLLFLENAKYTLPSSLFTYYPLYLESHNLTSFRSLFKCHCFRETVPSHPI